MLAASLFLSSVHAGDSTSTVIVFTSPEWCKACQRLETNVLRSAEWAALPHAKRVVDFDESKLLARRHKVKSIPTAILLDSKGQEIGRKVGYNGESAAVWLRELDGSEP
jgi:thioredoxin-like negative regulator of GroEL